MMSETERGPVAGSESPYARPCDTPNRQIRFTSVYEDGDEVSRVETVRVVDYSDDALEALLWPMTGSGRTEGNACYWAESVDGMEPVITKEWC